MLYFVTRQVLDRPIATFAARQLRAYQVAAPNGSIAEGADQTRKRNLGKRCVMTAGLRFQYQTIAV